MTLIISLKITNSDILQTAISLTGTLFTMACFVINCRMLKEMKR